MDEKVLKSLFDIKLAIEEINFFLENEDKSFLITAKTDC
jgi:hypothetical protein